MKKIVLFFAMLLSFSGVAMADDATAYDDPETAAGVEPKYSTEDGVQYAYYVRNLNYSKSFLSMASSYVLLEEGTDAALKFSFRKEDGGILMFVLDANDNPTANKLQAAGPPKVWITSSNPNATYYHEFEKVSANDDISYFIKSYDSNGSIVTNKSIYAKASVVTDGLLYGTASESDEGSMWQFIPANDAAKDAALGYHSLTIATGDEVHGNLATFSSADNTIIPDGYEAYSAAYVDGAVTLTKIEGNVIPANTGVILKGDAATVQMKITEDETSSTIISTLNATSEGSKTVADDDNIYALGYKNNTLGFYKVKSGVKIGAHKAYLNLPTSEEAVSINFGNVTGVTSATATAASKSAEVYDLSGRRISTSKSGIRIENGKKVIK